MDDIDLGKPILKCGIQVFIDNGLGFIYEHAPYIKLHADGIGRVILHLHARLLVVILARKADIVKAHIHLYDA